MKSYSMSESRVKPAVKGISARVTNSAVAMVHDSIHQEIERAINNVKRSAWDKSFRRQWYRAAARRRFAYFQANRRLSGEQRRGHEKSRALARDFYSGLGYQVRGMSCVVASAVPCNRTSIMGWILPRRQETLRSAVAWPSRPMRMIIPRAGILPVSPGAPPHRESCRTLDHHEADRIRLAIIHGPISFSDVIRKFFRVSGAAMICMRRCWFSTITAPGLVG